MTVPLTTLHALGVLPERCIDCDSRRCVDFACHTPVPPVTQEASMYEVVTPYGTEKVATLTEAKHLAQYTAKVIGRAVTVKKAAAVAPNPANPGHDTPCVCGTYDRCTAQREADFRRTGNWRDLHRAYND